MEHRFRAVYSGLGAFAVLGVFLAGVPACLVRLVGNPLPAALPAWSSVVATVESGVLPPGVLIRVVAVVVWIWWSQVALSFVAEVAAACRGRTARPLPLRAFGMQPVVMRLVAILVTAAGTLGLLAQPVLAATPSFAGIVVPATSEGSGHGVAGESPVTSSAGAGAVSPLPAPQAPVAAVTAPAVTSAPHAPILAPPGGSAVSFVAAQPASVAESTAPILAPPETPSTLSVPPGQGSPFASPAPMLDVAESTLRAPLESLPPARRLPTEVPAAESVSPALRARPESISAAPGRAEAAERSSGPAEAATEIGESGWVVVKPGDSLWLLAETHLGDALRWEDIYDLNSGPLPGGGTLRDPNLIHPGWRLRLPLPDPPASSEAADRIPDTARTPADPPPPGLG